MSDEVIRSRTLLVPSKGLPANGQIRRIRKSETIFGAFNQMKSLLTAPLGTNKTHLKLDQMQDFMILDALTKTF